MYKNHIKTFTAHNEILNIISFKRKQIIFYYNSLKKWFRFYKTYEAFLKIIFKTMKVVVEGKIVI